MNCDTGALDPHALTPALTVTFACAKRGHYLFPAAEAVGELIVADIGVDAALTEDVSTFVLDAATIREWLPPRPANSHKGAFGKVMLAVGSEAYPGAPYLASAAAGRAGAGLVTVAALRSVWALVAAKLPEPTYLLLPDAAGPNGAVIAGEAATQVADALSGYRALVLGCGLGNTPATQRFVADLLASALPATVIDADGLNCLAARDDWPQRLPPACVLTPHPAEMARLCGLIRGGSAGRPLGTGAAHGDDLAVRRAAQRPVHRDRRAFRLNWRCCRWRRRRLASAGSGDVLAGVIGGCWRRVDALSGGLHRRVAARHGGRDVRGGDRRRRRGWPPIC
jgi:hydroxyethylthiazole kinase-like uncharacterized protein yjeF